MSTFYLGIYQFKVELYPDGTIDPSGKGETSGDMVTSCTSKWIRKSEDPLDDPAEKDLEGSVVEDFSLAPGT